MFTPYDYQTDAANRLENGKILCGGVGSGKSITSIDFYFRKICGGEYTSIKNYMSIYLRQKVNLIIITTSKKRDAKEWEKDFELYFSKPIDKLPWLKLKIDSWNNISKYKKITSSFFIFDEQRLVGSGVWVKSFYKIAKNNKWILLTATPGDTWIDYIPVFVANKFYDNKTDFNDKHVIYNRFCKYPKVEGFKNENRLNAYKKQLIVDMGYMSKNIPVENVFYCSYDKGIYDKILKYRREPFTDTPFANASEICYALRRVSNGDKSRITAINFLLKKHSKLIIFYNFNYELEMLREIDITQAEYNGHKHENIPKTNRWIYLVQYNAGAEAWNCIETNVIVFYSLNYSYKIMTQAAGRIDRQNTKFDKLYYYKLMSKSSIDLKIESTLKKKKNFNIIKFIGKKGMEEMRKSIYIPKDLLRDLYITQGKSTRECASILNVSDRTIRERLREYDIPTRSVSEAKLGTEYKPKISKQTLIDLYVNEKLSANECGKILGVYQTTICDYLRRYDIPIR